MSEYHQGMEILLKCRLPTSLRRVVESSFGGGLVLHAALEVRAAGLEWNGCRRHAGGYVAGIGKEDRSEHLTRSAANLPIRALGVLSCGRGHVRGGKSAEPNSHGTCVGTEPDKNMRSMIATVALQNVALNIRQECCRFKRTQVERLIKSKNGRSLPCN